jgi:hypothetical protein
MIEKETKKAVCHDKRPLHATPWQLSADLLTLFE